VTNAQVFRPLSGIALATTVFLICLILVAFDVSNIAGWIWAAATCIATWLVFVRPKLLIGDEGVTVVNPLVTATIGWGELESIDVKYAVTFYVAGRKISAWAATGPGRYHARSIHRSELMGVGIPKSDIDSGNIRPGESPRTASGQAIAICRLRWQAYLDAVENGQQPVTATSTGKFDWLGAGALVVCVVAGLAVTYFA
jgi:hypothetical protein